MVDLGVSGGEKEEMEEEEEEMERRKNGRRQRGTGKDARNGREAESVFIEGKAGKLEEREGWGIRHDLKCPPPCCSSVSSLDSTK